MPTNDNRWFTVPTISVFAAIAFVALNKMPFEDFGPNGPKVEFSWPKNYCVRERFSELALGIDEMRDRWDSAALAFDIFAGAILTIAIAFVAWHLLRPPIEQGESPTA